MVRRIGFAQALINDPDVIFLDEPTSGMDPIVAAQMKDLMVSLRKRGKTIMMSSHLLADIEDVCDRIAIMHEGKLLKVGSMKDSLTLKDQIQITIRNLPAEAQARIKEVVAKAGAEVVDVTHPSETLEALFLRTIKESKSQDGPAGSKPGA
jgi:ABC-2 type transport system ATP-binding protein